MFSVSCVQGKIILNDFNAVDKCLKIRHSIEGRIFKRKFLPVSRLSQGLSTEEVDAFSLAPALAPVQRGRESFKSECNA